jgi:hypothetical protein
MQTTLFNFSDPALAALWTPINDGVMGGVPFSDFLPNWRGQPVHDAPPLNSVPLRQVGLMIADRQEGTFALALRSIAVEMP